MTHAFFARLSGGAHRPARRPRLGLLALETRDIPAGIAVGDPGYLMTTAYNVGPVATQSPTFSGQIAGHGGADVDLFAVQLTRGQRLAVDVTDTWNHAFKQKGRGLWGNAIIFSPSGQVLWGGAHQGDGPKFTVAAGKGATADDKYFVGISARGNDKYMIATGTGAVRPAAHMAIEGQYRVTFRIQNPTNPRTAPNPDARIDGTPGADAIVIRDANDPAGYEFVVNGAVADSGAWADLRTLTVSAGDGNDTIALQSTAYARHGVAIRLEGGAGNDVLDAGLGNDTLVGGVGDDTLYGRAGNDRIEADAGADHAHGMEGSDIIWGAEGNDELTGGIGNDTLYGESGNDIIWSGAGDDFATGGDGDDGLSGDDGNDTLLGEAGNDQLSGSDGADELNGGAGADAMWGGTGNDQLTVERGVDGYDPGEGVDIVTANASPGGQAVLRLATGGKVLDVEATAIGQNGAKAQLWDNLFGASQQWAFEAAGGGYYVIRNLASGKALDAHNPDVNRNGCRVQQWDYLGGANQQWAVEFGSDGLARIRNRASGKVLDARADHTGLNGGELQLWDDLGGANQRWCLGEIS